MPRIIISRPRDTVAVLRSYKLYLDGIQVGRLRRGRSLTVDTTAGDHSLEARIDWASSPRLELHLRDGQELAVECRAERFTRAAIDVFVRPGKFLEPSGGSSDGGDDRADAPAAASPNGDGQLLRIDFGRLGPDGPAAA